MTPRPEASHFGTLHGYSLRHARDLEAAVEAALRAAEIAVAERCFGRCAAWGCNCGANIKHDIIDELKGRP